MIILHCLARSVNGSSTQARESDAEMDSEQQCYAPMLLPVMCVPYQHIPPFTLPPSADDSSDCSCSVADSVMDDVGSQLECAMSYQKEWCEVEGNLFIRLFPMPLLCQCFVESDDGEYRHFGSNPDWDMLFQVLGYQFRYIAVLRQETMNVTFFDPKGERKILQPKHGLRKIRAYPDILGVLINNENEIYHLQVAFNENSGKTPLDGLEKTLVFAILSAARRECSKHISFW